MRPRSFFVMLAALLAFPACKVKTRTTMTSLPERADAERLLALLDLDRPGLERVRDAREDPVGAAAELLAYFRARKGVQPLMPEVAERAIEIAEDATRNVLIASPAYPRHDFGERIDWYANASPKGDIEWSVQLQRHSSWTALGQAYQRTGDERYAAAYSRQLLDWLESCPYEDKRARKIAWRRIEMGIRGHQWTCHFNYFLHSPSYTPRVMSLQLLAMHQHARLLTGTPFSRNNWGTMEAEGTAFIAFTFPEFRDSESWRTQATEWLAAQIEEQVFPDGMHRELCWGYHNGCIRWFGRMRELAELNGTRAAFPPSYGKRLEQMTEIIGRAAHPDGTHSMFGDDRNGSARALMTQGARNYPRNERIRFLSTSGAEGTAPPTQLALPDAGIYSIRSDWSPEAVHLILKCGPDGGWHCHPDNCSFELFAFGRYLMPDSGCYIYHGDDEGRSWFRRTRSHQTLTVEGRDNAYAPRLRLWRPGSDDDVLVVENDGGEGFTHRRAVFFVRKRFFVIVDEALGEFAGRVWQHFQLAPGEAVFDDADLSVRTASDEANVLMMPMAQEGLARHMEEGRVSFKYAESEPRPAFRYELAKDGPARFVTMIVPYRGDAPKAEVISVATEPGAGRVDIEVALDGERFSLGYNLE